MKTSDISREATATIKGAALVLMFVHHFFTFPDWLVVENYGPWLQDFADLYCAPTKLCVPVFAFLTGYFYCLSPKSLGYSLRKITDLLISYWVVYIPLLMLAVGLGCLTVSKSLLLLEAFGLTNQVMSFCWYIWFYCVIMLLLPLMEKLNLKSLVMELLVLLAAPAALLAVLYNRVHTGVLEDVAINLRLWYLCVPAGYLCGKHQIFRQADRYLGGIRSQAVRRMLWVLMIWVAFRGRYFLRSVTLGSLDVKGGDVDVIISADILYAPLFIYGASRLLDSLKDNIGFKLLRGIGRRSMLMWFWHCVFFNVCGAYTQKILYFPRNPVLVVLNGLLLCYLAASLTEPVRKWLLGRLAGPTANARSAGL